MAESPRDEWTEAAEPPVGRPEGAEGAEGVGGVILAFALAALIAVLQALTPSSLLVPVLNVLPLTIAARSRRPAWLWVLAGFLAAVAFVPGTSAVAPATIDLVNRILAAAATLAVAMLLHGQVGRMREMERRRWMLLRQNRELEALNEEVEQREEEIVRQNEELQSQTEELERQSEELRLTNEDLATRERALELLLELSRNLSLEFTRERVMSRVCESLSVLVPGNAVAVLERKDDVLRVVCHQDFPGGVDREVVPLVGTFSSLVLAAGHTAYIEDLNQRPDVIVPHPVEGPRFRAVLSTPVRLRGRPIGTLEVYAVAPSSWSDAQVAVAESIAAQLGVSLQGVELLEDVEQERRRFAAAFRSVPVGMLVLNDAEGRDVRINPAAAALLGIPQDENLSYFSLAGRRFRSALRRRGRPAELGEMPAMRALSGEETHGEEFELVLPDGRRRALVVSAAPFHDPDGVVYGGVEVLVDVTVQQATLRELELRRREAEEASTRKTRFLAAVSHDIRTPANAINLMTEVIRRAAATPEMASQVPEIAQRLQRNVASLLDLVGDLLDLSRFDSGKMETVETEFALDDLLQEEAEQLRPVAAGRGLTLEMAPLARPIWLHTDRVKLARVIGNLIDNALKFTPSGSVRVEVEPPARPGEDLRIHVRDTGIGIAADNVRQIFDEFLQLRNPERDRAKGSGLGLAICKRLVDVIGGRIEVASRVGEGSTFTVVLPPSLVALRLDPGAGVGARDATPSARDRLQGLRVLLVEDHAESRDGAGELLRQEGAHVEVAPDGKTALRLLREVAVDVILLDLMLPDMDGTEVLQAVAGNRPAALKAVLVVTGDLHHERVPELKSLPLDAVLQKPVDVEALVSTLQALKVPPSRHRNG